MVSEHHTENVAPQQRLSRRTLIGILIATAVLVTVLDQLSKQWALNELVPGESRPLIGDLITLQLIFNPGAAFGMASGTTWIFSIIAVLVTAAIIYFSKRLKSLTWAVLLGLLLGGAIGNLIDRLFREPGFPQGHVVDFINYSNIFIGNVADIAIVAAAAGIAIASMLGIDVSGKIVKENKDSGSDSNPVQEANATSTLDGVRESETTLPAEEDSEA